MHKHTSEQLGRLFGSLRAENLSQDLFDFFTIPGYFPELEHNISVMLVGGRGTGKTTALKMLSYEGCFARQDHQPARITDWPYYGIYYRINTAKVGSMRGGDVSDDNWVKVFGHFLNLTIAQLVLKFMCWVEIKTGQNINTSDGFWEIVQDSLCIDPESGIGLGEVQKKIAKSLSHFQSYINNLHDQELPNLSLLGYPIEVLVHELHESSYLQGKPFFFLFDEYENLEDYQQKVINTLIKHTSDAFFFKVGVKETGNRIKETLAKDEVLIHPHDYILIDIGEKFRNEAFSKFARSVCEKRLENLKFPSGVSSSLDYLLPSLTIEEEADLLASKAGKDVTDKIDEVKRIVHEKRLESCANISFLKMWFLCYEARIKEKSLNYVLENYNESPESYKTRFDNYKYALLFTIRRNKRGISKYYTGWKTFSLMASGNIRYFLELVRESLFLHSSKEGTFGVVDFETQTKAAQTVALSHLTDIQGFTLYGAQLSRLVLAWGRIFEVMAKTLGGNAPEINQFHIKELSTRYNFEDNEKDIKELLNNAVMHSALVRNSATKLIDESSIKDFDYMLHPIFSSMFCFSHRKKRKLNVDENEIWDLITSPPKGIKKILSRHGRPEDLVDELPEQLELFGGFYEQD